MKKDNIDIYYDEKYDTPYYLLTTSVHMMIKAVLINILKKHYNQEESEEEIANIADDIL